jgi:hypothetical protein
VDIRDACVYRNALCVAGGGTAPSSSTSWAFAAIQSSVYSILEHTPANSTAVDSRRSGRADMVSCTYFGAKCHGDTRVHLVCRSRARERAEPIGVMCVSELIRVAAGRDPRLDAVCGMPCALLRAHSDAAGMGPVVCIVMPLVLARVAHAHSSCCACRCAHNRYVPRAPPLWKTGVNKLFTAGVGAKARSPRARIHCRTS